MCGIVIAQPDKIKDIFSEQTDRGLDGMGATFNKKGVFHLMKNHYNTIIEYNSYIDKIANKSDGLVFLHHRKASVGDIKKENAHPFMGKRFILMQNGTARKFHLAHNEGKETDSEALLHYIEERCKKLSEVAKILGELELESLDSFGTVVIVAPFEELALISSDGERESFITIEGDKFVSFKNYDTTLTPKSGYKNSGNIIFNTSNLNIIENTFENLNTEVFKKKYIYPAYGYANQIYSGVGSKNYYGGSYYNNKNTYDTKYYDQFRYTQDYFDIYDNMEKHIFEYMDLSVDKARAKYCLQFFGHKENMLYYKTNKIFPYMPFRIVMADLFNIYN